MTLRLKIHLIVGALTLLFVVAIVGLQVRSMRESVNEEVVAANRVAAQLLNRTAWRYAAQGTPAMLTFLQEVGRIRSNEVMLFDAAGAELYRSPPSPYKAGRDAPAWFAHLLAPRTSEQSIAFPDGRLVVQANASRAILDAWDELAWLVGGAVLMIALVNLLVFWLVGRTVRPFGRIVGALHSLEQGRFDVQLPPLPGREAATIGAAFNRMVTQLQGHIETERRAVRAEAELSASRELTRWIDRHVEQERRMIARELHDEFGQSVTAIRSMALSIAQRSAGDPPSAQAATLIAQESSRLYDAMHGIIPRLTPLVLDSLGLAEALAELAERTRSAHPGVTLDMKLSLPDVELTPDASLALYRTAQEGITNALRHGGAQHLSLQVQTGPRQVTLCLQDDGRGFDPAASAAPGTAGHHGLRWLTERVEGLGGTLAVAPADPHGAVLTVSVPR